MNLRKWRWRLAQFFELQWWKRYLRKKNKEAYLKWKKNYWKGFLKKMELEIPARARCLDAGCGPAGIFTCLAGRPLDAVDPLLDLYEQWTGCFSRADYPEVQFISLPLEQFRSSKPYAYIFCLNALNHFENLQTGLELLQSHSRPETQVIISIDCHRYNLAKWIFRICQGDILHPQQHSIRDYERMIEAMGGEICKKVLIKSTFWFDYFALNLKWQPDQRSSQM